MKKLMFLAVAMIFSYNSFAGDAGYYSTTCTSGSKRTVLTILEDYSGMEAYQIYTLVIDGVPMVLNSSESNVNVSNNGDQQTTVFKDGYAALDFNGPAKSITVYQDPRTGTVAQNNATGTPFSVKVSCKDFWPEP